MEPTHEKAHIF